MTKKMIFTALILMAVIVGITPVFATNATQTIPMPVNVTAFENRTSGIVEITWDYPDFDQDVYYVTKVFDLDINSGTFLESRTQSTGTNTTWMYQYDIIQIIVKAILPANGIPEPIVWNNNTYYPPIEKSSADIHSNSTVPITIQICSLDFENRC